MHEDRALLRAHAVSAVAVVLQNILRGEEWSIIFMRLLSQSAEVLRGTHERTLMPINASCRNKGADTSRKESL